MQTSQLQSTVIIVAIILSISSACLIVNCPKGGKRSLIHGKDALRQCPRCGPAKMGHCYGDNICCGVEIGCLVATPETLVCQRESMSPDPCVGPMGGVPCGSNGKCAASGVCCTPDSCMIDSACNQTPSQEMASMYLYNAGNTRGLNQLSDVDEK